MASRYIQKYPIPQDFPLILKNFSRQILRDQPSNIIQYAAKYFEALEAGKNFHYQSAFNVKKDDKQYALNYQPQQAQKMERKELRINPIVGSISEKELQRISRVVDGIFLKWDHNKNGTLESGELREMLKELYKDGYIDIIPSEGLVKEFTNSIDTNHSGKISKKQMTVFVRKLLS